MALPSKEARDWADACCQRLKERHLLREDGRADSLLDVLMQLAVAFDAGKAARIPRWIPVSERLPEEGRWVPVYFDNPNNYAEWYACYQEGKWVDVEFENVDGVVCWFDLPRAPEDHGHQG